MSPGGLASGSLVCPGCGERRSAGQRFCESCKLPLVHDLLPVEEPPVSERRRIARKIKPQLAEGELVKVAWARNQTEGEFIQALLLEEGVPSLLRRTLGFDVPDLLAAGPRDVLVPQTGVDIARDVLLQADVISADGPAGGEVVPWRLAVGVLIAFGVAALVVWGMMQVVH